MLITTRKHESCENLKHSLLPLLVFLPVLSSFFSIPILSSLPPTLFSFSLFALHLHCSFLLPSPPALAINSDLDLILRLGSPHLALLDAKVKVKVWKTSVSSPDLPAAVGFLAAIKAQKCRSYVFLPPPLPRPVISGERKPFS